MAIATRATVSAVTSQLHTPSAESVNAATAPPPIEELERLNPNSSLKSNLNWELRKKRNEEFFPALRSPSAAFLFCFPHDDLTGPAIVLLVASCQQVLAC